MKLVTLICFLFANICFAQENVETELTHQEFEHAKSLYLRMMESEDFKKADDNSVKLASILKDLKGFETLTTQKYLSEEKVREWIENNVPKENKELATKLSIEGIKLQEKLMVDNQEVYKLIGKASHTQRMEILKPFFKMKRAKSGF